MISIAVGIVNIYICNNLLMLTNMVAKGVAFEWEVQKAGSSVH